MLNYRLSVRLSQCFEFKFGQLYRIALGNVLACMAFLTALPVHLYAFTPTPAQIEQFKNLSPQEQQALARELGVELPAIQTSIKPVDFPETVGDRKAGTSNPSAVSEFLKAASLSQGDEFPKNESDQKAELQPFGYDLFAGSPTTFAPATDIPIPVNYRIGPGDTILVQLYGKENSNNELAVSREGMIQFPEIGPVSVNGLSFGELKERINQLVSEQMIGVKASVTMGELRSIRVFVLGEAFKSGSYTVSSLSTMTNALFASGGIKNIGSLRSIALKRDGQTISTLDLYDLLIHGDTQDDHRLMPGDVLFIPTLKKTVAINGRVLRPAIYEIKDETSLSDLVSLAGGYAADAYPSAGRVKRINASGDRTVIDIDLDSAEGKAAAIRDGDILEVPSVLDKLEQVITVTGHVHRPGHFRWREGMRISDVIPSVSDLKTNPDLSIALLKQEIGETRRAHFVTFNLGAALNRQKFANLPLQPRDEIVVFEAGSKQRAEQIQSQIDLIVNQHFGTGYPAIVAIEGEVKSPGRYPLAEQMTVSQAIDLAGALGPEAARKGIILARQNPETYVQQFWHLWPGSDDMQQLLLPGDQVIVLSMDGDRASLLDPLMQKIRSNSHHGVPTPFVQVMGAVRFPGDYPLAMNATVGSLIDLAGGLKEDAYNLTAELSRVTLTENPDTYELDHRLLELGDPDGLALPLRSRDQLIIKAVSEWGENISVTLNGEVQFPGEYPLKKGETLSELIVRAGGITEKADPEGAVLLRESLRKKEQEMLDVLKQRLESDSSVAAMGMLDDDATRGEIEVAKQDLLAQVESTKALGRLVFDFPAILNGEDSADVILRDGDSLTIPTLIQEVSVLGEVNFPTSHLHEEGLSAGRYINKSGGMTRKADKRNAYVISRSGAVRPMYKWRFLFIGMKRKLEPGDTLIVPPDVDRLHPLTVWQKTSQILFQLSTTAAALNTVGAF